MRKSIISQKKGVTLVELLAVIVIIGILATISVVLIGRVIENTRQKADVASLQNLNEVTRFLKYSQLDITSDIFEGYDTDEQRINYLFEEGYISKIPEVNNPSNSFVFLVNVQQWILQGDEIVFTPTAEEYFTTNTVYTYRLTSYNPSGGLNVVIPQTIGGIEITELGSDSFKNLGLLSVVIQEGITRISGNAFQSNDLTSITIPDSVLRIWHNSFNDNQISSITFGSGVTRIEGGAFGTNQLTSLVLPDNITYVGDGAFGYGGNYITSITIGSNVTIGNDASFGWYGKTFRALYNIEKLAGTYTYAAGQWTKQ